MPCTGWAPSWGLQILPYSPADEGLCLGTLSTCEAASPDAPAPLAARPSVRAAPHARAGGVSLEPPDTRRPLSAGQWEARGVSGEASREAGRFAQGRRLRASCSLSAWEETGCADKAGALAAGGQARRVPVPAAGRRGDGETGSLSTPELRPSHPGLSPARAEGRPGPCPRHSTRVQEPRRTAPRSPPPGAGGDGVTPSP